MGRPRLHDERTERDLLSAAETLLAAEGAEGLSMRRVAEAAGTTPRAIYSLFGGRDGLLQALFREAFHALSADLDALPVTDDPRADLLAAGLDGFRNWAKAHPDLFRLAFMDRSTPVRPVDSEAGLQAFGRLLARIRRCVDAGLFPPGSETEIGLAYNAMCEGLASLEARNRLLAHLGRDPTAIWTASLEAVLRGFSVRLT
jgi:AcrR family transcriptional regulator